MAWSRGRPARALRRTKTLNRAGARGEQPTPLARTWRRRGPGDLGTDPYVRTAVRGGGRSALRRAHGGRWRRGAAGGWWRRGAAKCWGRIQKSGGGDPALFFAVKLVLNRVFEEHFPAVHHSAAGLYFRCPHPKTRLENAPYLVLRTICWKSNNKNEFSLPHNTARDGIKKCARMSTIIKSIRSKRESFFLFVLTRWCDPATRPPPPTHRMTKNK